MTAAIAIFPMGQGHGHLCLMPVHAGRTVRFCHMPQKAGSTRCGLHHRVSLASDEPDWTASDTLSQAQRRALRFLATVKYAMPSEIARALGGTGKPQALGRIGGRLAKRLASMGLVTSQSGFRHPVYRITENGRTVLASLRD